MQKFCVLILSCFVLLTSIVGCGGPEEITNQLDTDLENALKDASNGTGKSYYEFPSSDDFDKIPQDPTNPITLAKVELGKLLFHETGIAVNPREPEGMNTYSCASCHHAQGGFQACKRQGIGEGGVGFGVSGEGRSINPNYPLDSLDLQPIRTPSALNIAYQQNVLWNGQFGGTGVNVGTESQWTAGTPKEANALGFEGTETQAIAGLKVHRLDIESSFVSNSSYKALFDAAFPDIPEADRYTRITAGLAIAAYERTLLASESPFQKWLSGDDQAMTDEEKRGAILFFSKAGCYRCHNGPALNSMAFYALGMPDLDGAGVYGTAGDDVEKKGRGGFTGRAQDMYKFKVPQLYNLKDSPFYGHGATFYDLKDVVDYKNQAVSANASVPNVQLADEFKPLGLTSQEVEEIASFLEEGLHDPQLSRYVPNELPSGYCFPNNDTPAQIDLGCN